MVISSLVLPTFLIYWFIFFCFYWQCLLFYLLVRFSVFLGNTKDKNEGESSIQVLPPMAPRLILPYEATSSARISVKGLAEPGVMVELLKNDVAVEKLEVSEEGEFSFDGVDLLDGENEFLRYCHDGRWWVQ